MHLPQHTSMALEALLDAQGYAVLPGLLDVTLAQVHAWICAAGAGAAQPLAPLQADAPRAGESLHFGAVLPAPLQDWRSRLYSRLVPIAHRWNETLDLKGRYPPTLDAFVARHRQTSQPRPPSHLHRLRPHEHQPFGQRTQGEHVFPFQVMALLSTPGGDFTGGEFIMTEQRPRMQSRAIVVALARGDAVIIATGQRPVRGANGIYRVDVRHAIGRVRSGERIGLELTFHDAC